MKMKNINNKKHFYNLQSLEGLSHFLQSWTFLTKSVFQGPNQIHVMKYSNIRFIIHPCTIMVCLFIGAIKLFVSELSTESTY